MAANLCLLLRSDVPIDTFPHICLQARWLGGNDTAAVHTVGGAGALFLRPCAQTEAHMLGILQGQPSKLPHAVQQGAATAEQEFMAWCVGGRGLGRALRLLPSASSHPWLHPQHILPSL